MIGSSMQTLRAGSRTIAFGILAALDALDVVEEALAHHDDAAVARAEMLLRAVGDRALTEPRDEVLIHRRGS